MYNIIACDLDETLLNSKGKVTPKTIELISQARAKGVKFVLATGRGFMTVQKTLEEIGLKDLENEYVISFNGGCLTENKDNKILKFNGLTYEKANELFKAGLKYDVCSHIYTLDKVYGYNVNDDERTYTSTRNLLIETTQKDLGFLKNEKFPKILYQNLDKKYLETIEKDLGDLVNDIDVSYSSNRYIEFNPAGINKGYGLKALADYLNVDIKDCIAIGDNFNDLPMIKVAGLGVGVANTAQAMKQYCDYITENDCEHDAVGEVIEKFILK